MAITVDVLMARLGLDVSQVDRQAGDFTNHMQRMAGAAAQSFGAVRGIFQGVVGVAAAGGAALTAIITKGSREAAAAEQVWERLGQAISTNGLRARVTTGFVEELAVSLQKLTTQGDETTAQMATLLLKFEGIKGKEVFERTIKAAKDFAAATGQDAVGAVNMLARSLENPQMGARMLKMQAGLAASELKKIQDLEKAGYHTQAQEALLSVFEKKFKGAAEREANTFMGRMAQYANIVGDIFEEIGGFINPKIKTLIEDMTAAGWATLEWIKANRELIQMHVDKWWDRLAVAINAVRSAFKNVLSGSGSIKDFATVAGVFATLGKGLELVGGKIPIIGSLVSAVGRLLNPLALIRGLSGAIIPILKAAVPAITAIIGPIGWVVLAIGAVVAGIVAWIKKTESGAAAWEKFKEKLAPVLDWFKRVWGKFWDDHGEQITRIADKAERLLLKAWNALAGAATELGNAIAKLFSDADFGYWSEMFGELNEKIGQILEKFGSPIWQGTIEALNLGFKTILTTVETLFDLLLGTDTNLIKARWLELLSEMNIAMGKMFVDLGEAMKQPWMVRAGQQMIIKANEMQREAFKARIEAADAADKARTTSEDIKLEESKTELLERQAEASKETAEAKKEAKADEKEKEENPFAVPGAPAFDPNAEFDPDAPVPGWEWATREAQANTKKLAAIPVRRRSGARGKFGARDVGGLRVPAPELTGENPDAWEFVSTRDVQESRGFRIRENKRIRAAGLAERRKAGHGGAFTSQLEELEGFDAEVASATQGVVDARRQMDIASKMRGPGREEAIAQARENLQTAQTLAQAAQERFVQAVDNIARGSEELLAPGGKVADNLEQGAEDAMDGVGEKLGDAAEKAGDKIVEGGKKAGEKVEKEAVDGEKKLAKKKMEAQEAANADIANHLNNTLSAMTGAITGAMTSASQGNAKVSQMLESMSPEDRRKTLLSKAEAELFALKNSRGFAERSMGFGGVTSISEQGANLTKLDRQIAAKKKEIETLSREGYDPFDGAGGDGSIGKSVGGYNTMVSSVNSAYVSSASRYGGGRSSTSGSGAISSVSRGGDGPVSITINQQFAKKYSKDEVRELADGMEEEMRRRGRNMHGRSALRGSSVKLPQDSRVR